MTGLEWLARNLNDPWVVCMDVSLSLAVTVFFFADIARSMFVKGSRPRYVAASLEVWLGIPAMAGELWLSVEQAAKAEWLWFSIYVFLTVYVYWLWRRVKNEDDNWWTGRGKKIWSSIKSRMTIRWLVPVPLRSAY